MRSPLRKCGKGRLKVTLIVNGESGDRTRPSYSSALRTTGLTMFGIISMVISHGKCVTGIKIYLENCKSIHVYVCIHTQYTHTHIYTYTHFLWDREQNNYIYLILKTEKKIISIIKLTF